MYVSLMWVANNGNGPGEYLESIMAEVDTTVLWEQYNQGSKDAFNRLVENYLPMVKITAGRMMINLPRSVQEDDLYSSGCIGLINAVEKFDTTREVKFETYALSRIRGAMLDEMRRMDAVSRVIREKSNVIRQAEEQILGEGKELRVEEVAAAASMTVDEYCEVELAVRSMKMASLSDSSDDATSILFNVRDRGQLTPLEEVERRELKEIIKKMLSEKEALLIILYYYEELTLKEIGEIMEVTESRVCQMHTEILKKLEYRLHEWKNNK